MRARTLSFIGAIGVLLLGSAGPADAAFTPDATFDDDGAVVIDDGPAAEGVGVASAGGKTYVAYRDLEGHLNVARLTVEGDPDPTWGGGDGVVETSLYVFSIQSDVHVLANGKVLVVGGVSSLSGAGLGVVRLTAAGVPDTTFSGDGKAVKTPANVGSGERVAVDASGRIYVAGERQTSTGPGDLTSDLAVARFRANGAPDNTFSGDAIAYVTERKMDTLADLAVDRAGRVLLMGDSKQSQFDLQGGVGLVARLRPNGTPDPAFSGNGKMTFTFSGAQTVSGLGGGVDSSNRVAFGVWAMGGTLGAVRLTAGGALDTSYSGDGRAVAPFTSDESLNGASRVGNTMVFTGWGTGGQLWVGRLTAAGAPDTAFGTNGELLFDATANDYDVADHAAAGPSGSIVTAGNASGPGGPDVLVTRLNPAT